MPLKFVSRRTISSPMSRSERMQPPELGTQYPHTREITKTTTNIPANIRYYVGFQLPTSRYNVNFNLFYRGGVISINVTESSYHHIWCNIGIQYLVPCLLSPPHSPSLEQYNTIQYTVLHSVQVLSLGDMSEQQPAASLHCGDGGVRSLIYFICSVEVYGSDTKYSQKQHLGALANYLEVT